MKKIIPFLAVILIFSACKKNERQWNADVSNVKIDLQVKRFELEFFTTPVDSVYKKLPEWKQKYGEDFLYYYFNELLGLGMPEQKQFMLRLREFREYCDVYDLYNQVLTVFPPNDDFIEKSLEEPFKRFKYYFPDRPLPRVYTEISGFLVSVFTGDNNILGISLDKYLGQNYEIYSQMFENYLRRRMFKEMLPIDVMRAWATVQFPYNDSVKTLMTKMIYEGRLQYFLDVMFPNTADTLKWGYTYQQWGWANAYEDKIWNYLVDKKLLFSNEDLDIKNFTGEAPFTTVFHSNSAPRSGTFIGYKIVQSYMNHHPEVSLKQLMEETDYMKIYNQSYYNP